MGEGERIDLVIKTLAGNNAKRFSEATGIDTSTVSKLRNGGKGVWGYIDRICSAYPSVSRKWLSTGEGSSGLEPVGKTAAEYEREIRRLTRLVDTLERELRQSQSVIDRLLRGC